MICHEAPASVLAQRPAQDTPTRMSEGLRGSINTELMPGCSPPATPNHCRRSGICHNASLSDHVSPPSSLRYKPPLFDSIIAYTLSGFVALTVTPMIPTISFFGIPFTADEKGFAATFGLEFTATHRIVFLYYVILALALLTNWVALRLRRQRRHWEATMKLAGEVHGDVHERPELTACLNGFACGMGSAWRVAWADEGSPTGMPADVRNSVGLGSQPFQGDVELFFGAPVARHIVVPAR